MSAKVAGPLSFSAAKTWRVIGRIVVNVVFGSGSAFSGGRQPYTLMPAMLFFK